jgi:hypothetical protein
MRLATLNFCHWSSPKPFLSEAMKTKTKCVYPARGGGWFARCRGQYLGHAVQRCDAQKLVATYLRRRLKDTRPVEGRPSRYKGVCFHIGIRRYVTQVNGKTIGTYRTDFQAALALAKLRGVEWKSLRKTKQDLSVPQYRCKFRALFRIYGNHGRCKVCLPADLASSIRMYQNPQVVKLFLEEPALEERSVRHLCRGHPSVLETPVGILAPLTTS